MPSENWRPPFDTISVYIPQEETREVRISGFGAPGYGTTEGLKPFSCVDMKPRSLLEPLKQEEYSGLRVKRRSVGAIRMKDS